MNQYLQQIQSIALPNKYTKYYVAIIKKAQLRPQNRKELVANIGYVENHHILPKCFALGGVRDKLNMVFLTAKEHFIVHLCATRMFQNIKCSQMTFAFRQLRSANAHQSYRYMNSGLYAQLKPCFKQYVRLYKGENRKHIYIGDHDIINALLAEGWSKTMTVEYKVGRVGMMLGKKHSEETRLKISAAQIGVPRPKQRGIKHSLERIAKYKAAVLKVKVERPDEYAARCTKLSEILKAAYANGSIEKQMGMKNPCYGKHLSEAHKLKIRIGIQESHAIKQADTQKYEAYIRIRKSVTKKDVAKSRTKSTCKDL